MSLPTLNDELHVISVLDDEPNTVGGMSAAQLKAKFDEAAQTIRAFINDTFIPWLEDSTGAADIGISTIAGIDAATNVQSALAALQHNIEQVTQGFVADNSITTAKLANSAVTTAKIADGSVTDAKLANAKANTSALSDGSVTKLGTASVGSTTKPIYWNAGKPATLGGNIGSATKPVYLSSGAITASGSTVGASAKPIYMSSGTLTASSSNLGSTSKPIYMASGELKPISDTVGGTKQPVYLKAGAVTALTGTEGNSKKPVYLNAGALTAVSDTVGSSTTPVYINAGTPTTVSIDDAPTSSSSKLVKSGGVYSAIGSAVSDINTSLSSKADLVSGKVTPSQASSSIVVLTASTTLSLDHDGKFVYVNSSSDCTVTVPSTDDVAFPLGAEIEVARWGTGELNIVPGTGVTLRSILGTSSASIPILDRYGVASLKRLGTNVWLATGDIV